MSWKSCRSHKTCACGEAWHASEFLHLVLLGITRLHKLPSKSLIMLILPLSLSISGIKPQESVLCTDFKTTKNLSKVQLIDFIKCRLQILVAKKIHLINNFKIILLAECKSNSLRQANPHKTSRTLVISITLNLMWSHGVLQVFNRPKDQVSSKVGV